MIPGFCQLLLAFYQEVFPPGSPYDGAPPGVRFGWSAKAQSTFDQLKRAFTTAPICIHPEPMKPFTVETDASDFAIRAILLQTMGPHN